MDVNNIISNKVYESIQAPPIKDNNYPSTILYANKFSGIDPVEMDGQLKSLLDNYSMGLAGTKNILIQLLRILEHYPGGPWFVDSRNGIIYIHNHRKVAETDYDYYYAQEEGEVLSCTISTNWVAKRVSGGIVTSGINPNGEVLGTVSEDVPRDIAKQDLKSIHIRPVEPSDKTRLETHQGWYTAVRDNGKNIARGKKFEQNLAKENAYRVKKAFVKGKYDKVYRGHENDEAYWAEQRKLNSLPLDTYSQEELAKIWESSLENVLNVSPYTRKEYQNMKDKGASQEEWETFFKKLPLVDVSGTSGTPTYHTLIINKDNLNPNLHTDAYDLTMGISDITSWVAPIGSWVGKEILEKKAGVSDGVVATAEAAINQIYMSPNRLLVSVYQDKKNEEIKIGYFSIDEGTQTFSMYDVYRYMKTSTKSGKLGAGVDEVNAILGLNGTGAANQSARMKEKQVEMQLRVIGRPSLESSQTLYIGNIGEKWSGLWYVKTCIHQFDSSGYTCSLTLSKGPGSKSDVSQKAHTKPIQSTTNTGGQYMVTKLPDGTYKKMFWTYNELDYWAELGTKAQAINSSKKLTDEEKSKFLKNIKEEETILINAKAYQEISGEHLSSPNVKRTSSVPSVSDGRYYSTGLKTTGTAWLRSKQYQYLVEERLAKSPVKTKSTDVLRMLVNRKK